MFHHGLCGSSECLPLSLCSFISLLCLSQLQQLREENHRLRGEAQRSRAERSRLLDHLIDTGRLELTQRSTGSQPAIPLTPPTEEEGEEDTE